MQSACQRVDVNPELGNDQQRYWGTENPCESTHHCRTRWEAPTVEDVWWIELGERSRLEKASRWVRSHDHISNLQRLRAWALDFEEFLSCLGRTPRDVEVMGYHVKLPGMERAMSVTNEMEWADFMAELEDKMALDPQYRCRKPPPVILVCTREQAARYGEVGWEDAVARELSQMTLSTTAIPAESQRPTQRAKNSQERRTPTPSVTSHPRVEKQYFSRTENDITQDEGDDNREIIDRMVGVDDMIALLPMTKLRDDDELWPQACRFYLRDAENLHEGVQLPGMRIRSHPHQMLDAFKALYQWTSAGCSGFINGSKPGLGKTTETWIIYASIALAQMSMDDYSRDPDAHRKDGIDDCARGHPFGVQCYCVKSSMSYLICRLILRAPHLIVPPALATSRWYRSWTECFTPTVVTAQGVTVSHLPLILVAQLEEDGELASQHMRQLGPGIPTNYETTWEMPKITVENLRASFTWHGRLPDRPTLALRKERHGDMNSPPARDDDGEYLVSWNFNDVEKDLPELQFKPRSRSLTNLSFRRNWTNRGEAVKRERLVLICDQGTIARGELDIGLSHAAWVDIKRSRRPVKIMLRRCFQPSTICYDEFARVPDPEGQIITALRDLARVACADRAKVMALSGDPMPRGPEGLREVFGLISSDETAAGALDDAQTSFVEGLNAIKTAVPGSEQGNEITVWKEKGSRLLNQYMFDRDYDTRFMGHAVPDPRTTYAYHEPHFPDVDEQHEHALQRATADLETLLAQKAGQDGMLTTGQKNQVRQSARWHRLRLLDACPGLAMLGKALLKDPKGPFKEEALPSLRKEIVKAECAQLRLVSDLVQGNEEDETTRHALVLAINPILAVVIAEWIRLRVESAQVELFIDHSEGGPRRTAHRIDQLRQGIEKETPNRPLVIITTFKTVASGFDGLRGFVTVMVKFGEPWTRLESEQALARLQHQDPDGFVDVIGIYGSKRGPSAQLYERNTKGTDLALSDGILSRLI